MGISNCGRLNTLPVYLHWIQVCTNMDIDNSAHTIERFYGLRASKTVTLSVVNDNHKPAT